MVCERQVLSVVQAAAFYDDAPANAITYRRTFTFRTTVSFTAGPCTRSRA